MASRDRWVAIACRTDDEWARLAPLVGLTDPALATLDARRERIDEVEAAVGAWTATRTRLDVAEQLQALGIEAVPVNDFGDLHADPQVAAREHFVALTHPVMGDGLYERNGFRLSDAPERLRPLRPDAGPGQRLGPRRDPRALRRGAGPPP